MEETWNDGTTDMTKQYNPVEKWVQDSFYHPEKIVSPFTNDDFQHCDIHGDWCINCYYSPSEIIEDMETQGFLDCPYCLMEIVGI